MRASCQSGSLAGMMMSSRTYRADAENSWPVTFSSFPATVATSVQWLPSVLTETVKSRVLRLVGSPPAPAWYSTTFDNGVTLPRSTCSHGCADDEHHAFQ